MWKNEGGAPPGTPLIPTKEERVSKRARIVLAVIILAVVAGAVGVFALRSKGTGPLVSTATARRADLGVTVPAAGKVVASVRADVFPPAAGTLAEVYVSDGATVSAGEAIARMDTGPLELQVRQAKSGLAAAKAQLKSVTDQAPSSAQIAAAKAGVTAASAAYDSAKAAYDALAPSAAASAGLSASITALDLNVKQAYAALLSAKAAYEKAKSADVSTAKAAAQIAIDQADRAVTLAEANLGKATLVAPIDGVVFFNPTGVAGADGTYPKAATGTAVSPAAAPFSVVDLGRSVFSAEVDEADVGRVAAGMKATVTLDAFPGEEFAGTVTRIAGAAQPTATGGSVFMVDVAIESAGRSLRLGMKGDATIKVSSIASALTIPTTAQFTDSGESFVYRIESGKLVKTPITTGAQTDSEVEVLSGIKEGDVVALAGTTPFSDGMSVRVKQ